MRSVYRSEPMAKCELFLQNELAYQCISELGQLGVVQFQDLNAGVSDFQRKFVNDVRRCNEMQKHLAYLEREITREGLIAIEPEPPHVEVPRPKDMMEMEIKLEKMEQELRQVNDNVDELTRNYTQLMELQHVLRSVDNFFERRGSQNMFERNSLSLAQDSLLIYKEDFQKEKEATQLETQPGSSEATGAEIKRQDWTLPRKEQDTFSCIAGTISMERFRSFENVIWRVGKGCIFCRQISFDQIIADADGGEVRKSVFIVFFPGTQLKEKVTRICAAFHANVYECSSSAEERRESAVGVLQRIEDMKEVFNSSRDYRMKVLFSAAQHLRTWKVQLIKMSSVFHIMNMLNVDVTDKCLIVDCWIPENEIVRVQSVLQSATRAVESNSICVVTRVESRETPPTFYRTNKFTNGFQNIVNAYGIGSYGELNPAPYAIVTFPFLFAVMFGDAGHGTIMMLAALALIASEKTLSKVREEVVSTLFKGRFIILLMGLFSIYTGLIYNDTFSMSLNIFGTSWVLPEWRSDKAPQAGKIIGLTPEKDFSNQPYPFGLDPIWMLSTNKIQFTNSYKMKMAIILGLLQMSFGTFLSLWNHLYFKDQTKLPSPRSYLERVLRGTLNIWAQFIPEILFLLSLFGYLVFIIIYKWLLVFGNPDADSSTADLRGASCSRSLLMLFINLFMPSSGGNTPCYVRPLYDGAPKVEQIIVLVALVSVPWLLLAKPLFLLYLHRVHSSPLSGDSVPIVGRGEISGTSDDNGSCASTGSVRKKSTVSMHTLKGNSAAYMADLRDDSDAYGGDGEFNEPEPFEFGEIVTHQVIHTIEYCLGAVSNTASYLRLWALSLAHAQLSEVLWSMIFGPVLFGDPGEGNVAISVVSSLKIFLFWFPWAFLTLAILLVMEGLSAFLHALRLHWVEFMNKFFAGEGYLFAPFDLNELISELD